MRIALLQMQAALGDIDGNLKTIEQAAAASVAAEVSLLVSPELSVTGYGLGEMIKTIAQPRDGEIVSHLQGLADRSGLAICAGFPERDGADIYNTAVVVQPGRSAEFYRKCHLYGLMEKAVFRPSDAAPHVFDLGGLKAGLLICYDVEFPEMARHLALAGADLLIVPTALPASPNNRRVSEMMVPSRAMENQVFVAYADLCGRDALFDYEGCSVIAAPDGDILARAGRGQALLFADLDMQAYADCKAELPYLSERRPELYGKLAVVP